MKAVFLERGSFSDTTLFHIPSELSEYKEYTNTSPENVVERIRGMNIIMVNKVQLTADVLASNPHIKLILVTATGMNNVDLDYCRQHKIQVENVEGYATGSVPEHTFSLLLALRRNLLNYQQAMQAGRWQESEYFCLCEYPIQDLSGSHMVIFGKGSLGQKVASIARAFDMTVSFAEQKAADKVRDGYLDFETAISSADVISLHCPLTEQTQNMIAAPEFELMKKSCVLINTGRGGLVCEQSLANALNGDQIAGAAFDVASVEPMPRDHILQSLTHLPNFLLTPHVAWASDNAMQRLVNTAMEKLTAFLNQHSK